MNSYCVNVEPKEFVTINVSHSVEMRIINLQIGVSVDVNCLIKNENGSIFKVENVHIDGEEYNNWSNNDAYLVTTVLSKLGLTSNPDPPPVPN
jgi:hypothetical protein